MKIKIRQLVVRYERFEKEIEIDPNTPPAIVVDTHMDTGGWTLLLDHSVKGERYELIGLKTGTVLYNSDLGTGMDGYFKAQCAEEQGIRLVTPEDN